ncbi:toxin [Mycobacterium helveticum]|uniref:Toxin n=1 Tax=Mycobacterium helveticum TaxID=2592811 RepID=A0A557XE66_9MYCO|nr:toxin [Mycobacterium helveticum]TVS77588.1 toxin [Mycobacterium helveticum]TVS83868.1 toxin [Mycobacterium helveticum]
MITPGDITPRRDTDRELYVVVLSNAIHLAAATGRIITCPFIPGEIPSGTMAMIVTVQQPKGVVLPELVQWLPRAALDEPVGNVGGAALADTTATLTALVS